MNIDIEFISIINHPLINEVKISSRDFRILKSLAKSILSSSYITENQSRLLIKIIRENIEQIKEINPDIEFLIEHPVWSKSFRIADTTKKLYIKTVDDEQLICIEFAFSNFLRKQLINIGETLDNFRQSTSTNKIYYVDLTEKNIVGLVEKLSPLKFEINDTLRHYYNVIKSWSKQDIIDQYKLNTIADSNFKEKLSLDLGLDTPLTEDIIADRSIRYQYFVTKKDNPISLTEIISHRNTRHIWVNDQDYQLDEVITSLIELKRLPILFVFDLANCYNQLLAVHKALTMCDITTGIGIYFRVNNNAACGQFNTFISEQQYNAHLDENINVVGIPNGKVPKFFIKDRWQPMSVISLENSLRNNKTSVFLNCCDLIINYSKNEPLIPARSIWA